MSTKERVTRVIDGDTFVTEQRIVRLANVDTPEKGEQGYDTASQYLAALIMDKDVMIDEVARDTYGRSVAKVSIDGISVEKAIKIMTSSRKAPKRPVSKINDKTGNGCTNHKSDILWLKSAMSDLGRYCHHGEPHGYIESQLDEAVKGYQRDRGLRMDGVLNPLGETECAIRTELTRLGRE